MQEWIIAMLVISGLLILRDMAKTILLARKNQNADMEELYEEHPQKERIEKYAQSFQKLSETFSDLSYRKEYLTNAQVEYIFSETHQRFCEVCHQRDNCWKTRGDQTYGRVCNLIRAIECGREEELKKAKGEWAGECIHASLFFQDLVQIYYKEKQNLVWNNRMIENRLAVADQFSEVSRIMQMVAEDLYDVMAAPENLLREIRAAMKKRRILVKQVWVMQKDGQRQKAYVTMRARSGQCISVAEAAVLLSDVFGCEMMPSAESRCTINGEYHTISFVETPGYQILYGVAKMTKEEERVSGDNFFCNLEDKGEFVMCLSDGMGSGVEACKESEIVVELLEQFMDSGFSRETAVRLVNSSLVLQRQDEMFSTLDMCSVDLYTGICNFLKAGAATTFIKRDHWVEAISSTSLAVGLVQQLDYEMTSRKLYHGDYLIMVTDGVLDALPFEKEEDTMKEIIMETKCQTPRELGRKVLEKVLSYSDYRAKDDMTVLVAGLWKK